MRHDKLCPDCRSSFQFSLTLTSSASEPLQEPSSSPLCRTWHTSDDWKSVNSESSTLCTCVCTVASLTARGATTQPTQISMCEFGITFRAWIESSREGALVTLRDLPEVHAVRCSLVFSGCGLRNWPSFAVQLASPRASMSSLHRSRIGMISPRVRLVISDLCMLFDIVLETRALGLHRPTELNFGEEWSGTSSQTLCFFTESTCDVWSAPVCDSNFQYHLCGD